MTRLYQSRNTFASMRRFLRKRVILSKEVTDIIGKKPITIKGWITAYNKYGSPGLKTKQRTRPPRYTLLTVEKDHIKKLITDRKPGEYGFSDDFWSVGTLKQLVKNTYGVEYRQTNHTEHF